MTLSKQLYLIISFIFLMIFTGNFIISVNNFKEYLKDESITKSQDTATSLGMTLKSLIDNPDDPEIVSIIRAIANRGFYKEIRLERSEFSFTKEDLFKNHPTLDDSYEIKEISVDKNDGQINCSVDEDELANQLAMIEGEDDTTNTTREKIYYFIPSKNCPNNKQLKINFTASNGTNTITDTTTIKIDKVIVKVTREEKFDSVPQWFIDMLPMKMVETKSEISNGWKTKAIIYVSANAGVAYFKLYNQAKGAIYYAIISFIISFAILIIFLRFILKPLKDIENLAKNISNGHFDTIKNIPWTTELKNVSLSMNDMSNKIKNMINKLNTNLEKMTKQLSLDDLTGLEQEETFQTDMKKMFINKEDGYVLSIKIDDFSSFVKKSTTKIVDEFLKDFATALKFDDKDIMPYRFFGSTFAMIIKKSNDKQIAKIIQTIQERFEKLSIKYGVTTIGHIGATPFNPISTTEDILNFANMALDLAKEKGNNQAHIRDKNDLEKDMLEWKELVSNIIHNSTFNVAYTYQALSMSMTREILHEETFTSVTLEDGKAIPIGTFISVAERYNLIYDFDKAVVNKVINYIRTNNLKYEILINLAFDSILDDDFKLWLKETLITNKDIANQLVFSMTAYGCVRDIGAFKQFIEFIHQYNAKIILKRFETKFISLDNLKELHLDYIRLAKSYTSDILSDTAKQNFVESTTELAKLLNIKVFAENVRDEQEFAKLRELGIFGAGIKDILKYEGILTQGIISHCMKDIENNIVNIGIMGKVATISVELLQNMMLYAKDISKDELNPAGSIEVAQNKEYQYFIQTKNIISKDDKKSLEDKLIEISNLDTTQINKRYKELRKSGINTHTKGSGIGLYEIAKISNNIEYKFVSINENRYYFIFKVTLENPIKS